MSKRSSKKDSQIRPGSRSRNPTPTPIPSDENVVNPHVHGPPSPAIVQSSTQTPIRTNTERTNTPSPTHQFQISDVPEPSSHNVMFSRLPAVNSSSTHGPPSTYQPTIVQQAEEAKQHLQGILKPTMVTIGKEYVKLTNITEYELYKNKMLALAKLNGYIDYLEMNSQTVWENLIIEYGHHINLDSLYHLYRSNYTKISGMLQLSIAEIIPNYELVTNALKLKYPDFDSSNRYDRTTGGRFIIDNVNLIWKYICETYERKSIYNLITLYEQLTNLQYDENIDPNIFLSNVMSIWMRINEQLKNEVTTPGNVIPDAFLAVILLKLLPKRLNYIATILDTTDKVTPINIIKQLQTRFAQTHPTGIKLAVLNKTVSTSGNQTRSTENAANYAETTPSRKSNHEHKKHFRKKKKYHSQNSKDKIEKDSKSEKKENEDTDSSTKSVFYCTDNEDEIKEQMYQQQLCQFASYQNDQNLNQIENENSDQFQKIENSFSAIDCDEEMFSNMLCSDEDESSDEEIETSDSDQSENSSSNDSSSDSEDEIEKLKNESNATTVEASMNEEVRRMHTFKLDSGTTRHITCNPKLLVNPVKPPFAYKVKGLYGNSGEVKAIGSIELTSRVTLNNVWYIPTARTNLIAVSKITACGAKVNFEKEICTVVDKGKPCITFHRNEELYTYVHRAAYNIRRDASSIQFHEPKKTKFIPKLSDKTEDTSKLNSSSSQQNEVKKIREDLNNSRIKSKSKSSTSQYAVSNYSEETVAYYSEENSEIQNSIKNQNFEKSNSTSSIGQLWHKRLAHRNITKNMAIVMGLPPSAAITSKDCEMCALTKLTRTKMTTGKYSKASKFLQRLCIDTLGPTSTYDTTSKRKCPCPSLGECNYTLVIVDEFTRYLWTILIKSKSEIPTKLIELLKFLEIQFSTPILNIHSDCGTEFKNSELESFCKSKGINQTFTTPNSPQHNGLAERTNRTLINMVTSTLYQANLSQRFWGEAMVYCTYIYNRITNKNLNFQCPYGLANNLKEINLDKIHTFGCNVVVNYSNVIKHGKFETNTARGIFIGFSEQQNGFRILIENNNKIIISRDAKFYENDFSNVQTFKWSDSNQHKLEFIQMVEIDENSTKNVQLEYLNSKANISNSSNSLPISIINDEIEIEQQHIDDDQLSTIPEEDEDDQESITSEQNIISIPNSNTTRSGRISKPPNIYGSININDLDPMSRQQYLHGTGGDSNLAVECTSEKEIELKSSIEFETSENIKNPELIFSKFPTSTSDNYSYSTSTYDHTTYTEPTTYQQAIKCVDGHKWNDAVKAELDALKSQNVMELVPRPTKSINPLTAKWVFKLKRNEFNQPIKYKARLVARGYKQDSGIDYSEIFAPVARAKSIKLLLTIAAHHDLLMLQLDFQTAFLNSDLPDEIYLEIPEGYTIDTTEIKIKSNQNYILKLHKSLYGLKQAPYLWNQTINDLFLSLSYKQSETDNCIYYKYTSKSNVPIILSIYVDDVIILVHQDNIDIWNDDKETIKSKFKIDDIGELKWILKMKVTKDKNGNIYLDQSAYVNTIIDKYYSADQDAPTSKNPALVSINLTEPNLELKYQAKILNKNEHDQYRSLVGALLYLANTTRLDIAYIVNILCRYVSKPTNVHLKSAIHVLKYLKSTSHYSLKFTSQKINNKVQPIQVITTFSDADYAGDLSTRKST